MCDRGRLGVCTGGTLDGFFLYWRSYYAVQIALHHNLSGDTLRYGFSDAWLKLGAGSLTHPQKERLLD